MDVVIADGWCTSFPRAVAGFLGMPGVSNPPHHPSIEQHSRQVEAAIRERFAGMERRELLLLTIVSRALESSLGKPWV